MNVCRVCKVSLNQFNWQPAHQRNGDYICRKCSRLRYQTWRLNNPGKCHEQSRRYCFRHKNDLTRKRKEMYEKHKIYFKEYRKRPEIRIKERMRSRVRSFLIRLEILRLLGNKCIRCGNTDFRVLQIDHINKNGTKERAIRKILREIKEGSKAYQLLCANCNWIKRFENDEVVHIHDKPVSYKEIYELWKGGKSVKQLYSNRAH
jgi:hypothetical protein